jgi:hypothetical protein
MSLPEGAVTPEAVAEYNAQTEQALERVIALLDDGGWGSPKSDKDVLYWVRYVSGSSFAMIKSEVAIPKPYDAVIDRMFYFPEITPDMPAAQRDGILRRFLIIPEPSRFSEGYMYFSVESGVPLVSNRDFLVYRKHYERDGAHYLIQFSIENDAIMPKQKGFVRGKMITQAFIADNPGTPRIRCLSHTDPGGSIPAALYNMAAKKQAAYLKRLKESMMKP